MALDPIPRLPSAVSALALCAALALGCSPGVRRPVTGPTTVDPGNGGGSGGSCGLVETPDPSTAPMSIPKKECEGNTADFTCRVDTTDDGGAPPTPHPCQNPTTGRCDGAGNCRFVWMDGKSCNKCNGPGTCRQGLCI